jgi:uncharacterized membrane protein YfcA
MQLRAGVILTLTALGILCLILSTANKTEARLVSAFGWFLLAVVYAQVTRPRRRPGPPDWDDR